MKKILALTLLVMLLISAVTGIEFVRNAHANPALMPPEPPSGYRIYSDGTYTAQNLSRNDNTYTFTDDIKGTIVVQRDGVVLDGVGHTLIGNGDSSGIWIQNQSNVVIKNLNIRNFRIGITLAPNRVSNVINVNCSILSNTITNNTYGMSISASSKCYIAGNYIADNINGASLHGSDVFRNNRFEGNQYSILDEGYGDNDMDTSNTVDGKPIYYWVNQHDRTVPSDAGLVVLKNSSGIKVQNVALKGNGIGVLLVRTNSSTVMGNRLSANSYGVILRNSFNNTISDNMVTNNTNSGIEIGPSDNLVDIGSWNNKVLSNTVMGNGDGVTCIQNNTVSNNQIIANKNTGIDAESDCTITDNFISENLAHGIHLSNISGALIAGNNVTLNNGWGIAFDYGSNGTIKGNYIAKNGEGIVFSNAVGNVIMSNTVIQNEGWGIHLTGSHRDNLIYHNNFIDNNNKGTQAFVKDVWFYPDLYKRHTKNDTIEPPRQVPGAANYWDDGTEGNYWSDYFTRYSAAQKAENSAEGNTPYYINENNQDNHPLLSPHEISTLEEPRSTVLPTSPTVPPQETNPTPQQIVETEPIAFPTVLVITLALSTSAVVACLLLYFAKRKSRA